MEAGFACFSAGITIGRLYDDVLSKQFGEVRLIQFGTLLAAIRLGVGLLLGTPLAGVLGFGCVRLGYSGIVPILFRAAAYTSTMAAGTSITAVASVGYVGFLVGSAMIGFAAEAIGLSRALGIVALLAVVIHLLVRPIGIKMRGNG